MQTTLEPAIHELENELDKLIQKVSGLEYAIETLKKKASETNATKQVEKDMPKANIPNSFGDPTNNIDTLSASEKTDLVYHAIDKNNTFIRVPEIIKLLGNRLEQAQVRAAIISLNNEKKIVKVQPTTSNVDTYWGLVEWIEGDKVKGEHLYDKTKLVGRKINTANQ